MYQQSMFEQRYEKISNILVASVHHLFPPEYSFGKKKKKKEKEIKHFQLNVYIFTAKQLLLHVQNTFNIQND